MNELQTINDLQLCKNILKYIIKLISKISSLLFIYQRTELNRNKKKKYFKYIENSRGIKVCFENTDKPTPPLVSLINIDK